MLSGGWTKKIVLTLMACGFLVFGIQVLIAAYDLENPLHFLLTFFSANLIILISAALLVGFGFQIRESSADRSPRPPGGIKGRAGRDAGGNRRSAHAR